RYKNCLRNEAHQYNKPQQKAGANTSIILGHFQKRLTVKHKQKQKNPLEFPVFSTIIKNKMIIRACLKNYSTAIDL
ncbi:hypothetical protein DW904_17960, partial [Ruminococcus sp. AM42-11]|uniref:hypothetical protein n=1 Tax=Ruminococcus sp. AM42-11 TaxID=2292372 RepID=UPI000FF68654